MYKNNTCDKFDIIMIVYQYSALRLSGILSVFLTFISWIPGNAFVCHSEASRNATNEVLQIHIVPHTHDDVGWLKTVDQYYYGANNSIQRAGVQYILDSVVPALEANPMRRFIYVEMAFFKRWWMEQNPTMQARVKALVERGQLEFVNGGWCMNDEGTTHYNAIIDQMTLGLQFINEHFGSKARPRVAWQIDTFGHSAEQASLFAQMSFEGLFFARIHYADMEKRTKEQQMELMWQGSKSLGDFSEIFTGVLYLHYSNPTGFCFDILCNDPPIQDDSRLFDNNVKERVELFIKEACEHASHYKSHHIMLTMGDDFNYQNAEMWFKNLDKLMNYANKDGRVNVFYSTPSSYVDAVKGIKLEKKKDDFFPYANCPHCYWTGYFASRPALKGYVRRNNNLLQVCKQLEVLGNFQDLEYSSDALRDAMALAQHHDAVTGTEKQHVAYDYAKRLEMGAEQCKMVINSALTKITRREDPRADIQYSFCDYLNISVCHGTESPNSFTITVYNPVARTVDTIIRVPVSKKHLQVFGVDGKPVRFAMQPVTEITRFVRGKLGDAPYVLVFPAVSVPPLGLAMYHVNVTSKAGKYSNTHNTQSSSRKHNSKANNVDYIIENEHLRLTFSNKNGRLTEIENLEFQIKQLVDQQFFWYNSSVGNNVSDQASNAYNFRPNSSTQFNVSVDNHAKVTVYKNDVVQEIHQVFSPWVSQVVRLYSNKQFAEFEYTIGPIKMFRELGKEVVSRFDTTLKTNGIFYTDANGREMQRRKRDYRPTWLYEDKEPIAGNYYPVNSRAYIVDDTGVQLTVMTDRSVGGSSIKDGCLEFMIHRRFLYNDGSVGGEPLNEPGRDGYGLIVRGRFLVLLGASKNSARQHRLIGEEEFMRPLLAFSEYHYHLKQHYQVSQGPSSEEDYHGHQEQSGYRALTRPLPPNVHLLTLEKHGKILLLRLEHQFAVGEDDELSKPVSVQLKGLFSDFTIISVTELNLSANLVKTDPEYSVNRRGAFRQNEISNDSFVVTLNAMEIRTFKIDVEWKQNQKY